MRKVAVVVAVAAPVIVAVLVDTFPTIFGVTLGVAVILAINTTNVSTLHAIATVFTQATGKAHLAIDAADASGKGFPEDALARVERVPGVDVLVPALHGQVLLADEASPSQVNLSFFGAVAGGLMLYGVDPAVDQRARDCARLPRRARRVRPRLRAFDFPHSGWA